MDVRYLLGCLVVAVVMCRSPGIGTAAPLTTSNSIVNVVENKLKNLVNRGEMSMGNVTCDVCKIIVGTIQKLYEARTSWDEIAKLAGDICYWFKIEDERVCKSISEEFKVHKELCERTVSVSLVSTFTHTCLLRMRCCQWLVWLD